MEMDKDTYIEHLKNLSQRRKRTRPIRQRALSLSWKTWLMLQMRIDASFWRDMSESYEERWQDKTELLKRIGELS